jgi:hypothetical protein
VPSRRRAVATVLLIVFAGCLGGQPPSDEQAEQTLADAGNVEAVCYPAETLTLPENRSWRSLTDLGTLSLPLESRVYEEGTATVGGTDTSVVRIESDEQAWQLAELTLRVWVDVDTHRPVQFRISQRRSGEGATLEVEQTLRYDYGPTSVEIPLAVPSEDDCSEPS